MNKYKSIKNLKVKGERSHSKENESQNIINRSVLTKNKDKTNWIRNVFSFLKYQRYIRYFIQKIDIEYLIELLNNIIDIFNNI